MPFLYLILNDIFVIGEKSIFLKPQIQVSGRLLLIKI